MTPVPLSRLRRSRELLSDGVRRRLTAAILDGTLLAGERLHDDELIAWLGVSRTPIRTALERLAEIGLVEMAPNRFTRVATPSRADLAEALTVYAALTSEAAGVVVPELSGQDRASLTVLIDRVSSLAWSGGDAVSASGRGPDSGRVWAPDDLRPLADVLGAFARSTGNPVLLAVLHELETRILFFVRSVSVPFDGSCIETFARDLAGAIDDGDGAAAATTVTVFLAKRGSLGRGESGDSSADGGTT